MLLVQVQQSTFIMQQGYGENQVQSYSNNSSIPGDTRERKREREIERERDREREIELKKIETIYFLVFCNVAF